MTTREQASFVVVLAIFVIAVLRLVAYEVGKRGKKDKRDE